MVLGASVCTQVQRVVIEQHLVEKVDIGLGYSHGHLRPLKRCIGREIRSHESRFLFIFSLIPHIIEIHLEMYNRFVPRPQSQAGILGMCVPDFYCLKRRPD